MIYCIIYFVIGIILGFYWWHRDYNEEYKEAKINDDVEEGMAVLFIMFMIFFWPIKIILSSLKKFIKF